MFIQLQVNISAYLCIQTKLTLMSSVYRVLMTSVFFSVFPWKPEAAVKGLGD